MSQKTYNKSKTNAMQKNDEYKPYNSFSVISNKPNSTNQSTQSSKQQQVSQQTQDINKNKQLSLNQQYQDVFAKEKDERFRYLLKYGTLKKVEANGNIIFAELPQIPNIWVCYRRPMERDQNTDKLHLDKLELVHIPLLEGEEKLKILTYQHNQVSKIENLVSLPNLLYIDIYDNMIKEIEGLNQIQQIKVLLLPKNKITKIKNIENLTQLEVLDLHSNKITKIEGLNKLQKLRILNLANNQIAKIENIDFQSDLIELNLKINLIQQVENIGHLIKLEKLFLQNNNISVMNSLNNLSNLKHLQEINFENNIISNETNRIEYIDKLSLFAMNVKQIDNTTLVDLKKKYQELKQQKQQQQAKAPSIPPQQKEIQKQQTAPKINTTQPTQNVTSHNKETKIQQQTQQTQQAVQPKVAEEEINADEVIQIISQQWNAEMQRVKNVTDKKELISTTLIEGGHAEIEDDQILYIYGNAFEIVLQKEAFQQNIEKIHISYVLFDFLIESNILSYLKQKLKEIHFKHNYITNLLQLAKLEIVENLKILVIENSPVIKCQFLKEFIVYRFPQITNINFKEVKEQDRIRAKNIFSNFDKILQLPEKYYSMEIARDFNIPNLQKNKKYMHQLNKQVNEISEEYLKGIMSKVIIKQESSVNFEKLFGQLVENQISKYLECN